MLKLEERMNMELLSWSVSGLIFSLRAVSTFSEGSFGGNSKHGTDWEAPESRAIAELEGVMEGCRGTDGNGRIETSDNGGTAGV